MHKHTHRPQRYLQERQSPWRIVNALWWRNDQNGTHCLLIHAFMTRLDDAPITLQKGQNNPTYLWHHHSEVTLDFTDTHTHTHACCLRLHIHLQAVYYWGLSLSRLYLEAAVILGLRKKWGEVKLTGWREGGRDRRGNCKRVEDRRKQAAMMDS